jgi:PHP family Zn ribbon phosphoesterase
MGRDPTRFLYTIEFFPEEGKYHLDGHRQCGVRLSPTETRRLNNKCPVCGKKLTVGVLHRVDALADREIGFQPAHAIPAKHLLPLEEIIAAALGQKPNTKKVNAEYDRLVERYGSELAILLDLTEDELAGDTPDRILEGILRVRRSDVRVMPGYDGVYGKIELFAEKNGLICLG